MECIERGSAAWVWFAVVFCSALSTKLRPPHRHPGDNNTLLQDKPKSCGVHGVEVRKARYLEPILSSDTDSGEWRTATLTLACLHCSVLASHHHRHSDNMVSHRNSEASSKLCHSNVCMLTPDALDGNSRCPRRAKADDVAGCGNCTGD
jgi:hypothetical protein